MSQETALAPKLQQQLSFAFYGWALARVGCGVLLAILWLAPGSALWAQPDATAAPDQVTAPVWTQYGPVARYSHTAVFDPTTQQSIVFGGVATVSGTDLNDVWAGSTTGINLNFSQLLPTGIIPTARLGHVATYDANSNRMTIMGGGTGQPTTCVNDVWVLQNANGQGIPQWSSILPTGVAPPPRQFHTGVYDPNTNSLIVFGGSDCNGGVFNDVWVLSAANGQSGTAAWKQLAPSGAVPSARESSTAIYDSVNNVMTIYAGDARGNQLGDVWTLTNANGNGGTPAWKMLSPTGTAPMTRTSHTAVYDSAGNRMIVFGGLHGKSDLGDTWALTSANGLGGTPAWSQLKIRGTGPVLAHHSAVYNASNNNMNLFGGTGTQAKLATTDHYFTLTNANGTGSGSPKWSVDGPAVRYLHSAFYDAGNNSLTIFGGAHSQSALLYNDVWQQANVIGSNSLHWVNFALANGAPRPTPRYGHAGVWDSATNRMMMFGGFQSNPSKCVNDYWILQSANQAGGFWLQVSVKGTGPTARWLQASAYDSISNSLIVFGGSNCATTFDGDVWVLSNANSTTGTQAWAQLHPTGTAPQARESSSAVYDSATNSLIVFGGDAGTTHYGDIWVLAHANGQGGTPSWSQLTATNQGPAARSGHTAIYDATNNRMTIAGGYDGTNVMTDAWVLIGANGIRGAPTWAMLAPSNSGPAREFHSANYDPASNQLILFGGVGVVNPWTPESDIFSLTGANGLP